MTSMRRHRRQPAGQVALVPRRRVVLEGEGERDIEAAVEVGVAVEVGLQAAEQAIDPGAAGFQPESSGSCGSCGSWPCAGEAIAPR